MSVRVLAGVSAVAFSLWTTAAHAACSTDNDCPGDQICEQDACVVPPALPPAPPPPAAAPAPAEPAPAAAPAPMAAPVPAASAVWASPAADEGREPPVRAKPVRGPRNSTGMFVTGIVLVSGAGVAMLYMTTGMMGGREEAFTNGAIATCVLAGVGIPLMVIGGRRKPAAEVSITPFVSPQVAGAGLRLSL